MQPPNCSFWYLVGESAMSPGSVKPLHPSEKSSTDDMLMLMLSFVISWYGSYQYKA